MSKKVKINDNAYPFAWLDEVMAITLNPDITTVRDLQPCQLALIEHQFSLEVAAARLLLKKNTFNLFSPQKIKTLVNQYDLAIDILLNQAANHIARYKGHPELIQTGETLLKILKDFSVEIHQRYPHYLELPLQKQTEALQAEKGEPSKLICKLSVDQLGLLFKAADDLKVVISRSISMVFKTVVPFLSTTHKKHISWDSMRSSTYHPEQSDKEATIAMLEKMIDKIRGYN
jgi:hypothetical protein